MNDYIRKLAIDNVKKNKQFYKYIFLSIFFTFFIIIVVSNLSSSLEKISYEQKAYDYGKWDTIIITNDEEVVNAATKIADKVGKQYYGGSVIYNNENIGNIGYYDSEGYDLANLHLIEGALPSKEDDIVLEKSMSQKLNTKLNNQINIHYTYNNKEYNHTYNVVGIIEDYSNQWCSRGLSAITYTMDTQEYDLMLKGSSAINLWNSLIQMNDDAMVITDSGYDENGNEYTSYKSSLNYEQNNNVYNYPNIIFTNEGTYVLTDTPLTTTVLEIVVISLISIITTMMSSLNKRESQLSLLRSLGMTFKQIKRLLIYEGLYIAFIAFVIACFTGILMSTLIMYIYSLINQSQFMLEVNIYMLAIELLISILSIYVGIFIPAITIYDLPLTTKNGQYIYHPKKKKIRKPTFINLLKNEFFRNKIYTSFLIILAIFLVSNSMILFQSYSDYKTSYNEIVNKNYGGDFTGYASIQDLSSLKNQDNIHVYTDYSYDSMNIKYDDMDKEDIYREMTINIISIVDDEPLKQYLRNQGYNGDFQLEDNEVIAIIPNHNLDIGLKEGKMIQLDTTFDGEYNTEKTIKSVIHLNTEMSLLDDYTIIVNENTFQTIDSDIDYIHFSINADNNDARNTVSHYLVSQSIQYTDSIIDQANTLNQLSANFNQTIIFVFVMFILFIFLVALMRCLSINRLQQELSLLNILGMTKKKMKLIHIIYTTSLYIIAILLSYGWLFVFNRVYMNLYMIIFLLIIYIIYYLCMMIPIKQLIHQISLRQI